MISIVLYGRNDSYGYNLHKRGALSLNCMAEVLTDSADEILFVDYNTPDDFPTFPEAIRDTLTKRARKIMRILRVRPHIHERYKSRTHLKVLEPIARNVAVRRSNPSNRWILSTNTDMIFVPQHSESLTKIARDLPPGFYHAPRLEIPEALWESFDRLSAGKIIRTAREWGSALHLNEIVLGSKFIRYDGPGDFQLLLRSDLFENYGFDEEMLLGWHVDSNIAARLQLKYKVVGDLGERVYGYHCDHTRQVTPAHSHERVQNDWKKFVDDVVHPDAHHQAASWGCAGDAIEEIGIAVDPASVYVQALREVIGEPLAAPKIVTYTGETYNKVDYDPPHLMPFLADMFVSMPRTMNVGWYGARDETLRSFADIWQRLGFTGKIFLERDVGRRDLTGSVIQHAELPELLAKADTFLFDFGGLQDASVASTVIGRLAAGFRRVVRDERHRISTGAPPRRIIALNAINNAFEWFVCGSVAAPATPFATHMRHGFVLPATAACGDWLPLLSIGEAGVRGQHEIRSAPTTAGNIAYGPFKYLEEGRYLISLEIEQFADENDRPGNWPSAFVEVVAGPELLGLYPLEHVASPAMRHRFTFEVSENVADGIRPLETRIGVPHPIGIALKALTIEPAPAIGDKNAAALTISELLRLDDWLPFLRLGPLGRPDQSGVSAEVGLEAFVVFGPYWSLPIGNYEMTAYIECGRELTTSKYPILGDVLVGDRQMAAARFQVANLLYNEQLAASVLRLRFQVNESSPNERRVQTRIWSSGEVRFAVRSVFIRPVKPQRPEDLFPFLLTGEAGRRVGNAICNIDGRIGRIAFSPALSIGPGGYRLAMQFGVHAKHNSDLNDRPTCLIVLVKCGTHVLATEAIAGRTQQSQSQEINFEVSPDLAQTAGIECFFQAVSRANVTVRALTLEPVELAAQPTGPAACTLPNWLPFLQLNQNAREDHDDIIVGDGRAEFAIYGPYWTLPAGYYDLLVSIAPPGFNLDGKPVVILDIATDGGERQVVRHEYRLGQFASSDGRTAVELRLPFRLAADLPAASRTIETRIYTPGDCSFRVRSLAVKVRSSEPARNWFPYLTVGACGIHAGCEIKSAASKVGCVAYTPAMDVASGHYQVFLDIVDTGANDSELSPEDIIEIEIYSEAEILAIQTWGPGSNAQSNPLLEFDVTEEIASGGGIELYIRAIRPATISLRGLRVERTSNELTSSRSATLPKAKKLLSYFHVGAAGLREDRGVSSWPGKAGNIGYIRRRLPPGRYEAVVKVERVGGDPVGHLTITVGDYLLASQGIEFTPRILGPIRIPRGPFRICNFEVPAGPRRDALNTEVRIDSTGAGAFLIRSITVNPKTWLRELRDKTYGAAAKMLRAALNKLAVRRS
jgi:hypothetical protein